MSLFDRNPHYFRTSTDGGRLPRLDRLVLQILPDQDAQLLSLQAAESDGSASEIRPADYPQMKRLADAGRVQLLRLGTSLNPDGLWVNLRADAFNGDSRKPWLQRDEVRQAISAGIDRARFADVVFSGAADPASSPVTSSNKDWSRPDAPPETFDAARAKALLASAGLVDRDGDGFVDDVGTRHARFTVLTQKGQTSLERGAGEIREQMRLIGLELDVVLLDAPALIQRFLSGANYDAVYFNLTTTDTDPASQVDFWRRDGAAHVWNLGAGTSALPWEREIDALMDRQVTSLDVNERRRLFWAVQARFDEHRPIVYFAAPHVYVAVSTRLSGLAPALTRPQLLWSADTIDVAP